MTRLKFLLLLGILLLMGCDRDSDDGSTEFVLNQPEGSPVLGLPGPTPFVPSPSPADVTVDPLDLAVTGGTVHTFLVTISNVAGTGSVVASNMIGAASGTVTGLPASISFSALTQVGTDDYTAVGTFSAPLCGPGTVGTTLLYTEEDNTVARTVFFTVSAGGTCGGGSGGGGAGGGGAGGGGGSPCGTLGDTCDDAVCVTSASTEPFDTTSASSEGLASSCAGSSTTVSDVWFVYTPPSSGSATFSLCTGTAYDAAIAVYSDCPATSELACDDDFCSFAGPAEITLSVTSGTPVFIRIFGFGTATGTGILTVTDP